MTKLFSKMNTLFYISMSNVGGFLFIHILVNACYCLPDLL